MSDNLLIEIYRRAALFVFMAVEDFGIMPVEAMAAGTPALVNEVGGAKESVLAMSGGLTSAWQKSRFLDPTVVEQALTIDMTIAKSAMAEFSTSSFRRHILSWAGES